MTHPAILALEDGSLFRGVSIGAEGLRSGEVVFNTAMTGYQEIVTDPSYARQIVTLTCPHIGNVGANPEDEESDRAFAAGLVVRDYSAAASNWRSAETLSGFLVRKGLPGIAGVDTRRLTRILRTAGAQRGALLAGPEAAHARGECAVLTAARAFPGLVGMDLAAQVTTAARYHWTESTWRLEPERGGGSPPTARFSVVAYDFGVKRNILRLLVEHACRVTVVPAETTAAAALAMSPDGIFLSNGPGDPEPCTYAIEAIRAFLERKIPTFGICLGHQLLGLASGAKTVKMKFGHHGANHPVSELRSGRVIITSQNHGFAVDESSLPAGLVATHRSLFDGSLQGIECSDRPAFGFQGHPEASPGPRDARVLFARFVQSMAAARPSAAP